MTEFDLGANIERHDMIVEESETGKDHRLLDAIDQKRLEQNRKLDAEYLKALQLARIRKRDFVAWARGRLDKT